MNFYLTVLVILLIAASTIVGCISDSGTQEVSYKSETAYRENADLDERMVIMAANLDIEVDDFDSSFNALIEMTETHNGFVQDSSSYTRSDGSKGGYATIRVPEDEFLDLILAFEELGRVSSKSISGEDVTEEYIDLNARLNNSRLEEKRLFEILDMAADVEDILAVERELSRVRGEIERFEGRINYLEDRVSLSTITVSFSEPRPITHSWGIRDAISDAVGAFIATVNGMILLTGFILPFVIIGLVIAVIVKLIRKR